MSKEEEVAVQAAPEEAQGEEKAKVGRRWSCIEGPSLVSIYSTSGGS